MLSFQGTPAPPLSLPFLKMLEKYEGKSDIKHTGLAHFQTHFINIEAEKKTSPPLLWTILQPMPCSTQADLVCVIIVYTASGRGINGHPVT